MTEEEMPWVCWTVGMHIDEVQNAYDGYQTESTSQYIDIHLKLAQVKATQEVAKRIDVLSQSQIS